MSDEERRELPDQGGGDEGPGTPGGEDETPARGPRRLYRARRDRVLGGVAGGLGRYFGLDPIFFRIGFAALAFFGGAGVFLYVAAWIFVPPEGATGSLAPRLRGRTMTLIGAAALGFAGLALIGDHTWGAGWWWGGFLGPLALIAIGALLVWALLGARRRGGARFDGRWIAGRIALVIAVLAGSTVLFFGSALAAAAGGGIAVAVLVIAIGAMLVVAAFRGGARWLIVPALLLAIPAGIVSAAEVDLDGGVGDKRYRPASPVELSAGYELGIGRLEVDLRDVALAAGNRPLRVRLGVGEAVVIVPDDVCVALDSRIGAGYVRLFDRDSGGLDLDWDSTPPAAAAVPRLVLDADVGIGALQVVHQPSDVDDPNRRGGAVEDSLGNVGCERRPARSGKDRSGTP